MFKLLPGGFREFGRQLTDAPGQPAKEVTRTTTQAVAQFAEDNAMRPRYERVVEDVALCEAVAVLFLGLAFWAAVIFAWIYL